MSTHSALSCPQCGEENPESVSKCRACGLVLRRQVAAPEQPFFELRWHEPRALVDPGAGPPSFLGRCWRSLSAAGETAAAVAFSPEKTFRSFRFDGGMAGPAAYAVVLGGPSVLLDTAVRSLLSGNEGMNQAPRLTGPPALALFLLAPPLYAYLRAQVLHLVLVLRGQARAPFQATFRVVGYANASVAPLLILPFAGDLLFLAAGAVVEATGIRECHRLTLPGAVLAEVAPAVLLLIGLLAAAVTGLLWWSQTRG